MPEISVLTSVYNCESYLEEFLESIINQTFKDFELIIINDGSTDRSAEIIESYRDKRIKLFNFEKNQGIPKVLNFGLNKCSGKYIAKADSDDIYRPDRFEKQKAILDNQPEISVVGSQADYFPDNDNLRQSTIYLSMKNIFENQVNHTIKMDQIAERMYMYQCIWHSLMMIRSDILFEYRYDEDYKYLGEDYKLLYDLNKLGYRMVNIEEKLGKIRVREGSATNSTKSKVFEVLFKIKENEIRKIFNKEVFIWGASNFGINMNNIFNKNGLRISGFIDIDTNKIGREIDYLTIYSPEFIKEYKTNIIVASEPGRIEISDYLKSIGYKQLEEYLVF